MILVTGAAGKTGRAVVGALAAAGRPVRALVRTAEQSDRVVALGASEVSVGDLRDRSSVQQALQGARACYHICPNIHPEETSIGESIIATAEEAGVEQLVFHSVLHPQARSMPHHWAKLQVEEMLFESGLDYTILQPCAYMQNVLASWRTISRDGIYRVPYGASTRMSLIDLEDVAAIALRVLTENDHNGAIYELCGTEILTPEEMAMIMSAALGRQVEVEVESMDTWIRQARRSGLEEHTISVLTRMFGYYDRFGFWGSSNVAEHLLGRSPTLFASFVARSLDGLRSQ